MITKTLKDEIIEIEPDDSTSDRNKIAKLKNRNAVGDFVWAYVPDKKMLGKCQIDNIRYERGYAIYDVSHEMYDSTILKFSTTKLYSDTEVAVYFSDQWD